MFICIDCVVYSTMLEVLCVVGDSAGGPNLFSEVKMHSQRENEIKISQVTQLGWFAMCSPVELFLIRMLY